MFAAALLTVEMVPAPLWELSAKKLFDASTWARWREVTLAEAGGRCEVCGGDGDGRPLHCHEQWSYDDVALVQKLEALHALCERCHLAKTPGRAAWLASREPRYAGLPEQVLQRLASVNGWDSSTAQAYVAWSGQVNAARSAFAWRQDLSRFGRVVDQVDVGWEQACPRCFMVVPKSRLAAVSGGACEH